MALLSERVNNLVWHRGKKTIVDEPSLGYSMCCVPDTKGEKRGMLRLCDHVKVHSMQEENGHTPKLLEIN